MIWTKSLFVNKIFLNIYIFLVQGHFLLVKLSPSLWETRRKLSKTWINYALLKIFQTWLTLILLVKDFSKETAVLGCNVKSIKPKNLFLVFNARLVIFVWELLLWLISELSLPSSELAIKVIVSSHSLVDSHHSTKINKEDSINGDKHPLKIFLLLLKNHSLHINHLFTVTKFKNKKE